MIEKSINETHLGYIQNTITRMDKNSFQSKAWCITIVSALTALFISQTGEKLKYETIILACAIAFLFMLLDTYYLYLEKGYRELYKYIAGIKKPPHKIKDYTMEILDCDKGLCNYLKALLSVATGLFYIVIIAILILIAIYIK